MPTPPTYLVLPHSVPVTDPEDVSQGVLSSLWVGRRPERSVWKDLNERASGPIPHDDALIARVQHAGGELAGHACKTCCLHSRPAPTAAWNISTRDWPQKGHDGVEHEIQRHGNGINKAPIAEILYKHTLMSLATPGEIVAPFASRTQHRPTLVNAVPLHFHAP